MKHEITPHLRPAWKVYEEIQTVLEYIELKRTNQKKQQMRRFRFRQKHGV